MCRGHVKEERGVFPTGFIKTEDSINIMYFYGIFFKQGKVWSKFLYKFKFFLGASNFLKSAFEHNTVEDLVPLDFTLT